MYQTDTCVLKVLHVFIAATLNYYLLLVILKYKYSTYLESSVSFIWLGTYEYLNAIEMVKLQYNKTLTCCTLSYTVTQKTEHNFFELQIFSYIVKWVWQKPRVNSTFKSFRR